MHLFSAKVWQFLFRSTCCLITWNIVSLKISFQVMLSITRFYKKLSLLVKLISRSFVYLVLFSLSLENMSFRSSKFNGYSNIVTNFVRSTKSTIDENYSKFRLLLKSFIFILFLTALLDLVTRILCAHTQSSCWEFLTPVCHSHHQMSSGSTNNVFPFQQKRIKHQFINIWVIAQHTHKNKMQLNSEPPPLKSRLKTIALMSSSC